MRAVLLRQLYPVALRGLPVLGTPEAFAAGFRGTLGPLRDRAERLARTHIAVCSATGFVSGLGGWLALPVALPANLGAVALVQLHMAASIAALAGRDPKGGDVRDRAIACLIGEAAPARTEEEETLDRVGLKLAERGLNLLVTGAVTAAKWAGQQVAGQLVRRRLLRGIPLVGGVIGAVSDGMLTNAVAEAAIEAFVEERGDGGGEPPAFPLSGDGVPQHVDVPRPSTAS